MNRRGNQNHSDSGYDSFLDVVSNIVGILIILVVIVGAQVKQGLTHSRLAEIRREAAVPEPENVPPVPETENVSQAAEQARLDAELAKTLETAAGIEAEMHDLRQQSARLDSETQIVNGERHALGTQLGLIERQMGSFTDAKDVARREKLELNRKILEFEDAIKKAKSRLDMLASAAGENGGPKKIEHKETPIIRNVDTRESHFILQEGKVLYMPLEELVSEYSRRLQTVAPSLISTGSRTDAIGPLDGFMLNAEAKITAGRLDVFWKLVPPPMDHAETLDMALAPVSQFRHHLEKLDPGKDIVTFWIYPTGFSSFQKLRDEVYRMGFLIASRPLPEGTPIAGSPYGQKSVAQ
ncbi:MAG: hypothetical protein Q4D98_11815 [Planctomycetia bacterium]|nr:hypothetical protein [Planctomycetia bacterium]